MRDVKFVKAIEIFGMVAEIMRNDGTARITVTGMSMYPFLRENIDSVEISRIRFDSIIRGNIVVIIRDNGQYVMHRVLRKHLNQFYMIGDAQHWIEGPLRPDQLVAVVTAVWRGDKRIECTNFWWKSLSKLWLNLLPIRYVAIGSYMRLRRLIRRQK